MGRTSQSTENKISSPVKYYLTYKGDKGVFSRWDNEKKENVIYDELDIVLLDTRSSITGWSDEDQSKIYSNLVEYSTKEKFLVKAGKKTLAEGVYQDIKDQVNKIGGSFTANIFALANIDDEFVPVNIQLHSSALSNWSDYVESTGIKNVYNQVIRLCKGEQKKKGKIEWFLLNCVPKPLAKDDALALEADKFCIDFLNPYLNQFNSEE